MVRRTQLSSNALSEGGGRQAGVVIDLLERCRRLRKGIGKLAMKPIVRRKNRACWREGWRNGNAADRGIRCRTFGATSSRRAELRVMLG